MVAHSALLDQLLLRYRNLREAYVSSTSAKYRFPIT
jgi:hypothetical protein